MCKNRNFIIASTLITLLIITLTGCTSGADILRIKRELRTINKKLTAMNEETPVAKGNISLSDLYKRLNIINGKLKSIDEIKTVQLNQANIQAGIDDQISELNGIKGLIEDVNNQLISAEAKIASIEGSVGNLSGEIKSGDTNKGVEIEYLKKKIAAISTKISRQQEINEINLEQETKKNTYKFEDIESRVAAADKKITDVLDIIYNAKKGKGAKKSARKPPAPRKSIMPELSSSDKYQNAYNLYMDNKYDAAIEAFISYLDQNPNTRLSDNAQYWLGECYYSKKEFALASAEFNKVVSQYPKSDKIPSALLKSAYAMDILNKTEDALRILNLLIKNFPASEEAELGRKKVIFLQKKLTP